MSMVKQAIIILWVCIFTNLVGIEEETEIEIETKLIELNEIVECLV